MHLMFSVSNECTNISSNLLSLQKLKACISLYCQPRGRGTKCHCTFPKLKIRIYWKSCSDNTSQGNQTVLAKTADLDFVCRSFFNGTSKCNFKIMAQEKSLFSSGPYRVWKEHVHLILPVTTRKICMNLQINHLHSIFLQ